MKVIDWKPIKGFENLYEVSNTGEVRSLDHIRRTGRSEYLQKGKLLKSGLNKKTNYLMVSLSKNGKSITKYIHKLVAESFLDNPNGYKYINHKDENTLNNNVENLEWCSAKYNANYGNRNKKIADKLSKKINQYDLDNNFIKTWNSSIEIERTIGIDQSNVCLCCNGKRNTVGGYKWKYLDLDYLKSKGE